MGRGSSSSGGSSRGSSSFGGGSRGRSSFGGHNGHTTVIIGGGRHGVHYHEGGSSIVGIVVGAIFVLVGLFCVFGGFGQIISSFKYESVEARCVKNEMSGGWYYTTYAYEVEDIYYINRSNEGWEFPEDVDKVVTIYYLKSDPNIIYEEKPDTAGEGAVIIFGGAIFSAMGAIPMVLCIKELKKKKSPALNENNSGEVVKEETHTKCPYCGSKYKKTLDSCPKCGASKLD